MAIDTAPRLTLYGRVSCHLCEEMIAGLRQLQSGHRFEFDVIDVDCDSELARRYGERVPLLAYGEREVCRHFLDSAAVTAFLTEIR